MTSKGLITKGRHLLWLLVVALTLSGCGGGSGSKGAVPTDVDTSKPTDNPDGGGTGYPLFRENLLDKEIRTLAQEYGLTGDPASPRALTQIRPDDDPLVKLGQVLFFSQTLSGAFDVSCGSCHLPNLGASDGLSLSVGVASKDSAVVGLGREIDPAQDVDPLADGGPNMHRNSISTFNVGLIDRALLFDGRVFVVEDEVVPGGMGQSIRHPESGNYAESFPDFGLLEVMVKFPITNPVEMRGFLYADLNDPEDFREHLVKRLRGQVDSDILKPGAAENWKKLFEDAFPDIDPQSDQLVTLANLQRAIAAYLRSKIFIDTPWREYVQDLPVALEEQRPPRSISSELAKEGARLFFTPINKGGAGCVACHAGDRFTNEQFFNVGFPQIGRGFLRSDREDRGRWQITKEQYGYYAFRVPTLLNVAKRGPWGHAGTFSSLEQLIRYHADPAREIADFDWSLGHLPQFQGTGLELYPEARRLTEAAQSSETFQSASAMLPGRLFNSQIDALVAFLETLTDRCVADHQCVGQWAPTKNEDPDGFLTVQGDMPHEPEELPDQTPIDDYPEEISLQVPTNTPLPTFAEISDWQDNPDCDLNTDVFNSGNFNFLDKTEGVGLDKFPHGFSSETWFSGRPINVEIVMIAGGLAAKYAKGDCWPDIVYAGGEASGVMILENRGIRQQRGFFEGDLLILDANDQHGRFTGAAYVDLNGDYRRELLFGNMWEQGASLPVYAQNDQGRYLVAARLPMSRPTYGISAGFVGGHAYPGVYLGHWPGQGLSGFAPAFLQVTDNGTKIRPNEHLVGLSGAHVDQSFNFTPSFADLTGNGFMDLVIASDFGTSSVHLNVSGEAGNGSEYRAYSNVTDRNIITDENGMGGVLADFRNSGQLDWFVTSILDPSGVAAGNWGVTGNRYYKNTSKSKDSLTFEDVTELTRGEGASGIRDGAWGWGVCAADFNNNGFLDIFHVNGFGYIPAEMKVPVELEGNYRRMLGVFDSITKKYFQEKAPRLFVNNGDGTFEDRAIDLGLGRVSEGRGVACFDYDRDGDIDIVLLDHSKGLQFFENQVGHGEGRHFLNVRVVGKAPNTDALGARVYVTADVGRDYGEQTMMRVSQANSNFNSQNLPDLHFGLGYAEKIDQLRIEWPGPDGGVLVCNDLGVNQFLVFDQRDGADSVGVCP